VIGDRVSPPEGVSVRDLSKVTGLGPTEEMISLCRWAAWRWSGRLAVLLRAASPARAVRDLSKPAGVNRRRSRTGPGVASSAGRQIERETVDAALGGGVAVVRLAPALDPMPLLEAAVRRAAGGSVLVLVPRVAEAARLARRLGDEGLPVALMPEGWGAAAAGGRVVVGARGAALAPAPDLEAAVVLDAHDEAYREERVPTWHASVIVAERARRAGVPCLLASSCPTLELLELGSQVLTSRAVERSGWPVCEVVDLRSQDPRTGILTPRLAGLVSEATENDPVLCVLNRRGRASLLACASCGELARCERCRAALRQGSDGKLRCPVCQTIRVAVCAACGSTRLRNRRLGVTRVVEELAALVGRPVVEVTAETDRRPSGALAVGTEALLERSEHAYAVAFLDLDQELLSPTFRAGEQTLALLARAARLVGPREAGGRVLVQTRLPAHDVIDGAVRADPGRLARAEAPIRRDLGLPPASAVALLSGPGAPAMAEGLALAGGVEVGGPDGGRFLVRARRHDELCDALAMVARPAATVRVEVDPRRV
jgi:primosomal protein N' (replication factor Y) (superfamily II helicase)